MAVDIVIQINGIDGESQVTGHEGQIDILSWSWGLTQSGSFAYGGGGGSGRVSVQDLTFTKWVDSASSNLVKHCCNGTHIADATLFCRKAGGSAVEYIKVKMEEIIVSAVQTAASSGEDRQTETVSFNFAKFEYTYTPQNPDGSAGAEMTITWDITANAE